MRASALLHREPAWRDDRRGAYRLATPTLRDWLYEPASLTAKLRQHCAVGLKVSVIEQGWRLPFAGEAALLQGAPHTPCWLREVVLADGDTPLVLARSLIPANTLRRSGLIQLGERPLGEVLFACRQLRRVHLQLARLRATDVRSAAPRADLWARRSLYRIAAGDLLVCEFFLPSVADLT